MFQSECKECKVYFDWTELVVEGSDWDYKDIKARRCIPCHEEKYTKLNIVKENNE
jgi:hypothetical protein